MDNNKRKSPKIFVLLLILLIAIIGAGVHFVSRYLPSKEEADRTEYFGEKLENEVYITIGEHILEERALLEEDTVYLPLSIVSSYLNQRFYWDSTNGQILYATPSELTFTPAQAEAGSEVWVNNDEIFIALPLVQQHTDLDVVIENDPHHIAIWNDFEEVTVVTAKKAAPVRTLGGIKAPVLTRVSADEDMMLLEEYENWYQVATRSGYVGFIEKKYVSSSSVKTYDRSFESEEYTYLTLEEPVNLTWHQVTIAEANDYLEDAIAEVTGVNVISPTWYSLADNNGNITDISSAEYVAVAHAHGMQVWGLIDNFSSEISTYEILSNTSSRQNLVGQLVQSALRVGMDGINVDFETLSEETGVHFLEFLRELSIECHKNSLILSVDNPVPEDFTSHYDREEQGKVVDYVIIMGYDEHYYGSETAGPVASLPWVEEGIVETIAEVPAERVINAIPFYTRIWKTQAGTLSSEAVGMNGAQDFLTEYGVETYWDTDLSLHVGNVTTEDGIYYQIWVEDIQSLTEKLNLITQYELAGVASWKLGLEDSAIWQVISDTIQ